MAGWWNTINFAQIYRYIFYNIYILSIYSSWIILTSVCTLTFIYLTWLIEGSLEVKLPTIWRDEKPRKRKSQKKEDRRKKTRVRKMLGKSRIAMFFALICGSGGSRSRLAKAAGAQPMWAEEKWKMARRCGAKRICNSKSWTTDGLGPFLEVRMWKNGTVMRRSAFASQHAQHSQHSSTTFGCYDVQKVAPPLWRGGHHLHEGLGPFFWFVSMSQLWQAANWREGSFTSQYVRNTCGVRQMR